jgi:hypothetical protein
MVRINIELQCNHSGCLKKTDSASSMFGGGVRFACPHWKINIGCNATLGWFFGANAQVNLPLHATCNKCNHIIKSEHKYWGWPWSQGRAEQLVCKCGYKIDYATYESNNTTHRVGAQQNLSHIAPLYITAKMIDNCNQQWYQDYKDNHRSDYSYEKHFYRIITKISQYIDNNNNYILLTAINENRDVKSFETYEYLICTKYLNGIQQVQMIYRPHHPLFFLLGRKKREDQTINMNINDVFKHMNQIIHDNMFYDKLYSRLRQ